MQMQTEALPLVLLTSIREYIVCAYALQRMSQLIGMSSVVLTVHDRSRLYKWTRPETEPTLSQPRFSPTVILYMVSVELVYPCILMSFRILLPSERKSSGSRSLPIPNALVAPLNLFVLPRSLRLRALGIAS